MLEANPSCPEISFLLGFKHTRFGKGDAAFMRLGVVDGCGGDHRKREPKGSFENGARNWSGSWDFLQGGRSLKNGWNSYNILVILAGLDSQ